MTGINTIPPEGSGIEVPLRRYFIRQLHTSFVHYSLEHKGYLLTNSAWEYRSILNGLTGNAIYYKKQPDKGISALHNCYDPACNPQG